MESSFRKRSCFVSSLSSTRRERTSSFDSHLTSVRKRYSRCEFILPIHTVFSVWSSRIDFEFHWQFSPCY